MIAFALSQKGLLNVSSSDSAFASMVSQLLPVGFKGIVVCGLLAALMSSLASLFNSSAALFVGDFYKKYRPQSSGQHLVIVGRIATAVVVLLGVIWIPVMLGLGKVLYDYLQSIQGLLAPAIASVFLLGVFWKRATANGAFAGMVVGFGLGMVRLLLNVMYGAKVGIVNSAQAIYCKIQVATETTIGLVNIGIKELGEKITDKLPADMASTYLPSLQTAKESLVNLTQGRDAAAGTMHNLANTMEAAFVQQHGIFYQLAAINAYHLCGILFLICILTIIGVSLLTPKPSVTQLNYTYYAADAKDRALTRSSITVWDIVNTIIIMGVIVAFYIYFW
jgi:Na+/proline symporter